MRVLASESRCVLVVGYFFVLAACSSGAGDGGGSGALSVTVDRTALDFAVLNGMAARGQALHFTLANASGTYYGLIGADRSGLFRAGITFTSASTATVSIVPSDPPLGRTTGNLTFQLCTDQACGTVVWSKVMPYTITVFTVATQGLAFTGTEGATTSAQSIAISPADDDRLLEVSVETASSWLSVARGMSSFDVAASAQGLKAGTYQGKVVIGPQAGGDSQLIPVTFAVGNGLVTPAGDTLALNVGAPSTHSMPVVFRGGISPSWSATADKAWLVLTKASGTGEGVVQYTVDPAQASSIANWESEVAKIVIGSPGLTAVAAQVTLYKQLPEIYSVFPSAVAPGQPVAVTVFGRGLNQLTGTNGIDVSGMSDVSSRAISDTQAVTQLPALSAGTYTVSVPNAVGIATATASLTAIEPSPWLAASVANAGEKRSAFYDPSRRAVFAVNRSQNAVVRYRLVDGAWQVGLVPIDYIGDIAISADRRTLYVTSGNIRTYNPTSATLLTIDPETLAVGAPTYPFPASLSASDILTGRTRTAGLAVTNNGRVWFSSSSWTKPVYFDPARATFAVHTGPSALGTSLFYNPAYYASADGSRLIIAEPNGGATYVYTPADDRIAKPSTAPSIYLTAASDRDGRWAVIDDSRLYDTDTWLPKGFVQVTNGTGVDAQLSPDGSRLYVLVMSASSYDIACVEVFDTTSLISGTTTLVKLGEIPIASQASACSSNASYDCSRYPIFVVSPLGEVLFLVGNQSMVVVPIPNNLAGIH